MHHVSKDSAKALCPTLGVTYPPNLQMNSVESILLDVPPYTKRDPQSPQNLDFHFSVAQITVLFSQIAAISIQLTTVTLVFCCKVSAESEALLCHTLYRSI